MAASVRLAVFDVDGVLTDSGLLYTAEGETVKRFDVRDGLGLKMLLAAGIEVAIITARDSAPLRRRLADLGISHFYPGCSAKLTALVDLTKRLGIALEHVAYTGDDLVDLQALRAVGFPIAVRNAHRLVKQAATWTTNRQGGDGAVREIAEALITARQDFEAFVESYLEKPKKAAPSSLPKFSVVIPARFASTRLPGKPLLLLAGRPMIQHVYENALGAGAEEVVVATDDRRVHNAVLAFGGRSLMTSAEHSSGTDRIAEVARKLHWEDERIVVNLQGDEPLLDKASLHTVAELLSKHPDAGISTLATPIVAVKDLLDPNIVKVVLKDSGLAQTFSRAPIPWVRDSFGGNNNGLLNDLKNLPDTVPFLRHLGLYAYRVGTLKRLSAAPQSPLERAECLEQLRALAMNIEIAVATVSRAPGHGVDTPEDFARVEKIYAQSR